MIKKILFAVCIMMLGVSVKAVSPVVDYQENIYSNRIGDKLYSGKMAFISIDNHIVYCLDPYKIVGKDYYEDNKYLNNISEDELWYFEMVAYYGYNNTNRNSIYYYIAAQELIWERMIGNDKVFWTTGTNNTGEIINIDSYKQDIIDDIDRFFMFPSFTDTYIMASLFDEHFIVDQNNVLDDFNIEFGGKNNIKKLQNMLHIKFNDLEKQEILLIRKLKTDNSTTIYKSNASQTLASFGIDIENSGKFEIRAYEPTDTKLSITFYDKTTNDILNDIDFGLCNENGEKMNSGWININNKYIYNNKIPYGKYSLCQVPTGYVFTDDLIFNIEEDFSTEIINIDLYLTTENKPIIPEEVIPPIENNIDDSTTEIKQDALEIKDDNVNKEEIKNEEIINDQVDNNKNQSDVISLDRENKTEINQVLEYSFDELPNTNDYNYSKYIYLLIIFFMGITIYEIKNIRG